MDLAANASGIHVLIKRTNGNIVYYYLNSSGVVNSGKTYTMESAGDFPNIVASNNIVYALYNTSSNIKGKYSTNGGTSWSSLPNNINTTANLCNGVDAVYEESASGGVHLVWATRDNGYDFETYYYRLNSSNQWVEFKNVTDHSLAQVGGRPSVSFSSGRVHVSFNTSYFDDPWTSGNAGARDRLNGVWQTPQSVVSGSEETVKEKLLVRGSTLFMFYSKWNFNGGLITNDLVYRTRSVSGTTWSNPTTLAYTIEESGNAFNVTKTANDNIHIVVYPQYVDPNFGLAYRNYNGSSWTSPILLDTDPSYGRNVGFTSVSNDLFLTFMRGSDNYLRHKQYDAAPLAQENYNITIYKSGTNRYPKLTWSLNNEPDVRENTTNAYTVERRTKPIVGQWSGWSTLANLSGSVSSFIDYTIGNAGNGDREAEYRLTSKDIGGNISPSQSLIIEYGMGHLEKKGNESIVYDFELSQNYPNPFNPSTIINYAVKDAGLVSIKVYDILGKEVAILVNETKEAGNYEVDFNAATLPSGVYIYTMQVNGFTSSKKMLLIR